NRLCTFPSPDAMDGKVKFVRVEGVYDRGFTKCNKKEAEALVEEVIRRLQDPVLCRSSMGVVTFSSAQQNYIERLITKAVAAKRLEREAYEREEPLFVKNLENVQGDERDVILFSVCYGPDASGRVSLNFGPLNQSGGWRRLNVAVSRAREEMIVFSTMTSGMIDLAKTSSKGVAGLKSFLDFAERGKTSLAVRSGAGTGAAKSAGIGKYIAAELSSYGYECRYDVGASDFKIDVAVVNPKNRHEFILAILCDATREFSVKDRNVLQIQSLKRANWNVLRINCVNYYNNPKREIKRIKEALDRLTGTEKKGKGFMRYARNYKAVAASGGEAAAFVTGGEHDAEIAARLKEIVAVEEPISRGFLKTRCLQTFGILKSGARIEARLDALIDSCAFKKERAAGTDYYYKNDRAVTQGKFRVENEPCLRKNEEDFTAIETLALLRAALEEKVSLYFDELMSLVAGVYRIRRPSEQFAAYLRDCVSYGESRGVLVRSVSDRITLA
ncbi:MAG: AAA domain-containing protein, partial [Candidatus Scatosoma sp.]